MGSRSKWEDMVSQAKYIVGIGDDKGANASDVPLGSGTADKAKNDIQDYAKKQKDAIDNQTDGN